jgi:hypothetical protein
MRFKNRIVCAAMSAALTVVAIPAVAQVYRDYTPPAFRLEYGSPCQITPPYCVPRRAYWSRTQTYGAYADPFYGAAPMNARRRRAS